LAIQTRTRCQLPSSDFFFEPGAVRCGLLSSLSL